MRNPLYVPSKSMAALDRRSERIAELEAERDQLARDLAAARAEAEERGKRINELDTHVERVERLLIMCRPLIKTHRSWKSAAIVEKIDKALEVNWDKQADEPAARAAGAEP